MNVDNKDNTLINYDICNIGTRGTERVFTCYMGFKFFQKMTFESLVKFFPVPKDGDRMNISNAFPFSWKVSKRVI